jgi:hypothetical protein
MWRGIAVSVTTVRARNGSGTSWPASDPATPGALVPATTNAPDAEPDLACLAFLAFRLHGEIPLLVAQCAA